MLVHVFNCSNASRGQNGICTIIGAHMKVKGYLETHILKPIEFTAVLKQSQDLCGLKKLALVCK
jgi:hypothetical protein